MGGVGPNEFIIWICPPLLNDNAGGIHHFLWISWDLGPDDSYYSIGVDPIESMRETHMKDGKQILLVLFSS